MKKEEKFAIYKYTNIHNGLIYIGMTSKTLNERWQSGYRSNKRLYSDIRKYGKAGFKREILQSNLTLSEAKKLEKLTIQELDALNPKIGYNVAVGGTVGMYGHKHSEETKRHFSKSRKGESNSFYGKHHTNQETWECAHAVICLNTMKIYGTINQAVAETGIKTIENCVNGAQFSAGVDENGNKLYWCTYMGENFDYEKRLERMMREEGKASLQCRPVRCIENGEVFKSAQEADDVMSGLKGVRCYVSRCCRGERKTTYGYHWEYITDEEILKDIKRNYSTRVKRSESKIDFNEED